MLIPSNFDNTVVLVEGSPITSTQINAMLATWNNNGYWMTSLEFVNSAKALILFAKVEPVFGFTADQKVNTVTASQAALDADKATEIANGYWPTGIFVTPGGASLILYQQLGTPAT